MNEQPRAPRNRTLTCTPEEIAELQGKLLTLRHHVDVDTIHGRIILQDVRVAIPFLPETFIDLLIIDPPYNLTKDYHGHVFRAKNAELYTQWFDALISSLLTKLKPRATIYVCSDWQSSTLVFPVLAKYFHVRNRITWERDKGRGAKTNWKNNTEDIWFCTLSKEYTFNLEAVKMKRHVIAPYRNASGQPKDWEVTEAGNYRFTHPSNFWSDITIPFWSMPENTDHPTQKPEKLIAKLVLASSNVGDFVFDPFLGSGTTAVVAEKLERKFSGVELNIEYCCWTLKRLQIAKSNPQIQGYDDGVFWERNSTTKINAQ